MAKLKIILIAGIVLAGTAATLTIQHKSQIKLSANEASLREQEEQLAALTTEHARLSNQVATAHGAPPEDHTAELAKLRGEAEALKKQTNDPGRRLAAREPKPPTPPSPAPATHTPEYWQQLHQMEGSKGTELRDLALAFSRYAWDHQGQSPTSLDSLVADLAKQNWTLSGTNQYEIIYHGSFDDLEGIPIQDVAVLREQQAWPGPDGKMFRVYGMGGGVGLRVSSDDNFVSWEAKHVILPPAGGQRR